MNKPIRLLLAALTALTCSLKAQSVDTLINTGLSEPYTVTVDSQNNYYIADGANNRILKYIPDSGVKTNLAGVVGNAGKGFQEGPGFQARFYNPQGIVFARGGLVVADSGNHLIRFVSMAGVVSTIAGTNELGSANGIGTAARFNFPAGVAADAAGNIYVADLGNNSLRKIDTANQVTTLASSFYRPSGVAVASDGRIFIADSGNHSIMVMTPPAAPVLFAGRGSRFLSGYSDAFVATQALFNTPRGLLWIGGTNQTLYVADSMNQVVRTVYTNAAVGGISVGTVAATETAGLMVPTGLARDVLGDTLIVDVGANSLRRITATQTQTPVAKPKIGTIALSEDAFTGQMLAKLTEVNSSTFNNDVIVGIQSETGTETFYTLNGPDPSPLNGTTPPALGSGSTQLPTSILSQNQPNASPDVTVKAIGIANGRRSSEIATARFQFQVANPSFLGSNPGAVMFESATTNALIYYTNDGSEPTQASTQYANRAFSVVDGTKNVTVKARAFRNGYASSRIVTQIFVFENLQTSSVGILTDFKGGVGSHLIVPINVILNTNDVLKSLQFRVEVKPEGDAPPLVAAPKNLMINPTYDFIVIPSPLFPIGDPRAVKSQEFVSPTNANLAVLFITSTKDESEVIPLVEPYSFTMSKSGIVAVISVGIPANAVPGQTYSIAVLYPSGTSDGLETPVPLQKLPARTITVQNLPFTAGDTAQSIWYNAGGDFGSGNLNNNDVNNAFYASVGWRVPYPESDVFRAMNVFGGENPDPIIGIEDWQTIFTRSLRLDLANQMVSRGLDGFWHTSSTNLNDTANVEAEMLSTGAQKAWDAQVTIKGGTVENAQPGALVRVPVNIEIAADQKVSALQLRGTVASPKKSPRFNGALRFVPIAGIPNAAFSVEGKGTAAYGWPLGSFNPPLSGKVLIGHFEFTLPATAAKGDRYLISFQNNGALHSRGNGFGVHKAQSIPASIWVDSAAAEPADPLPDEWKEHFFGRIDHPLANPNGDADGDGVTNLQEFLQGRSPAKVFLQQLDSEWRQWFAKGFKLRWLAMEGKTYRIESSTDLTTWTEVTTVTGLGELKEFTDNNSPDKEKFYRIRLVL